MIFNFSRPLPVVTICTTLTSLSSDFLFQAFLTQVLEASAYECTLAPLVPVSLGIISPRPPVDFFFRQFLPTIFAFYDVTPTWY